MRAIMLLDEDVRSKILDSDSPDENFEHLKIECRAKGKHHAHQPFGEQLFRMMQSVRRDEQRLALRILR